MKYVLIFVALMAWACSRPVPARQKISKEALDRQSGTTRDLKNLKIP